MKKLLGSLKFTNKTTLDDISSQINGFYKHISNEDCSQSIGDTIQYSMDIAEEGIVNGVYDGFTPQMIGEIVGAIETEVIPMFAYSGELPAVPVEVFGGVQWVPKVNKDTERDTISVAELDDNDSLEAEIWIYDNTETDFASYGS